MRFIFEDLYANDFFTRTLYSFILGSKRATQKHRDLIDCLLSRQQKIHILTECTSMGDSKWHKIFEGKIARVIECYIVCRINDIPWKQISIVDRDDIKPDDMLFCYLYDRGGIINRYNKEKDDETKKIKCYKILDLNHFYGRIPQLKYYVKYFDCLVSETNVIEHSKLIHAVCGDYKGDFCVKPYTYAKRFKNKKTFKERKNKAVATGTWSIMTEKRYDLFKEIYGTDCLYPMRRELYENKEKWKKQIECRITHYPDDDISKEAVSDNFFLRWFSEKKTKLRTFRQSHYMSFDIVELYSDYKMAIIPEEINGDGLPAIGFVEAMACGCAYIGKKCSIYRELGMEANIHYIAYDGTSDDLIEKIKYYQKHETELEQIAFAGYQFVLENLNGYIVAENFFRTMFENAKLREKKNET